MEQWHDQQNLFCAFVDWSVYFVYFGCVLSPLVVLSFEKQIEILQIHKSGWLLLK